MKKMNEIAIARVNDITLLVGQDPEQLVPIKPICQALGINTEAQRQRIKRDELLSLVVRQTYSYGANGKRYKMTALPLEFIFGWLMSLDLSRVKEDARPSVIQSKVDCCKALYHHFSGKQNFLKEKQGMIDNMIRRYFELSVNTKIAYQRMKASENDIKQILAIDYETWIANGKQIILHPVPLEDDEDDEDYEDYEDDEDEPEDGEETSNE